MGGMNELPHNTSPWPKVLAITLIAAAGFVVGSLFAEILQAIIISGTEFPGGASRLATMAAPPWWAVATNLLGIWMGIGGSAIYIVRQKWAPALTGLLRARWSDIIYVLVGVGAQFAIAIASAPFHLGTKLNVPVKHIFGGAGAFLWLIGIMSILGAPFFEEVLFRGVIFRGVRARLSERNENFAYPFALIFSAALFALAHFELLQLPGLFSVGLLLGYVVHRTGRLAPAIISHASFNTVAFVVVTFVQHGKI